MAQKDKENLRLVRRTLIPLLVVALPISAMIAYILYYKQAHKTITPVAESITKTASFGEDTWPIFRGDAALRGQASGNLPDALAVDWIFETGDAVRSALIVSENTVFVSSADKHLYAIDLISGKEQWKFAADDELEAAPLYHNGRVYVGSVYGTFYCIDGETGKQQWSYEVGGKITGSANIVRHPQTHQTIVVFGCYDNNLYGLDADTGGLVLQHEAQSYINGSIAVVDNAAVFGSCDANVYWIPVDDPNSTKVTDAGSYVATNPAIDTGVIFTGTYEGTFLAADAETQKILWKFDGTEDAFLSAPAVNEKVVIVGCRDRNVYCFDRLNGNKIWTFSTQEGFDSSPVICGDKVAIGCDDGRLYLLDIASGKEIFSYTLGGPIMSSAAIAQNRLIIGCDNGIVTSFIEKH